MLTTGDGGGLIRGHHPIEVRDKMGNIQLQRRIVVKGLGPQPVGKTLTVGKDISEFDAKVLIGNGKAIPAPEKAKKPTTRKPKTTTRKK